ncbi:MAG TPA: hypothetical protein VM253_11405 [Candidatus Limnocylindrales bacterium]|nr:hypothetical protein [Candidatus Limnocylindrales bacterium]
MASIPKRQANFGGDPDLERLAALARSHEESTYRESLLESIFVAELVQSCAMTGRPWVEIARGFVDFQGYDLVATCGRITRHIQLKSSKPGVDLHRALADKPSACCIITAPYVDPDRRRIGLDYLWFGGAAGEPLVFPADARPAKTSTNRARDGVFAKVDRKNHLRVGATHFRGVPSIDALAGLLFDPEG